MGRNVLGRSLYGPGRRGPVTFFYIVITLYCRSYGELLNYTSELHISPRPKESSVVAHGAFHIGHSADLLRATCEVGPRSDEKVPSITSIDIIGVRLEGKAELCSTRRPYRPTAAGGYQTLTEPELYSHSKPIRYGTPNVKAKGGILWNIRR
jgi:hypothetical protein